MASGTEKTSKRQSSSAAEASASTHNNPGWNISSVRAGVWISGTVRQHGASGSWCDCDVVFWSGDSADAADCGCGSVVCSCGGSPQTVTSSSCERSDYGSDDGIAGPAAGDFSGAAAGPCMSSVSLNGQVSRRALQDGYLVRNSGLSMMLCSSRRQVF